MADAATRSEGTLSARDRECGEHQPLEEPAKGAPAPALECNGPRDCIGTERGCIHCYPSLAYVGSVGLRVVITNPNHPWGGASGVIVGTFDGHSLLDWTVELDEGTHGAYRGQHVAVTDREIQPDRRRRGR